jgi:hypothetical protein
MCCLRTSGPLILTALLIAMLSLTAHAQSPNTLSGPASPSNSASTETPPSTPPSADLEDPTAGKLPNAPGPHTLTPPAPGPQFGGTILGTVLDANGAEISDALVTLEDTDSKVDRTLTTDGSGFFKFDAVEPGRFSLTVTSTGFTPWVSPDFALQTGQCYDMPAVALKIASAMTEVEVTATRHDIAEDQMHFAEKQRVLGVFPNFYASYIWNAAPLSAGQKFHLALRTAADPVSIAIPAVIAAYEQSQNQFSGYGQGAQGFAKRFGASSADSLISDMIGDAILPTIFRQDPRYFYKGSGSIASRALYAIATVVICRGDNGHWQPNYSNVLGNLASASLSNLYYPSTDRNGVHLTIDNWLLGDASGAVGSLFQEFLVKKLSRGIQTQPGP